jgi:peptide/nickel transport system substrate-binding protein
MKRPPNSRPRWQWLATAGAVIASLLLAACGGGGSNAASNTSFKSGGTLTYRISGDWTTWDLDAFPSIDGQNISLFFYDRLLAVGPKNNLVPYLAKSWTATPTRVQFTLRKGARCADGTPITATVVANSLHRFVDPPTRSSQATRLVTAGPYTITADDAAGTVNFGIATPDNELQWAFINPQLGIMCPSGIANPSSLTNRPAGSGPYQLDSAVHGDTLTATLRPDWAWGPEGVTAKTSGLPARVVFKVVASDTTAANLLTTGGVDFAKILGPDVSRLQADRSVTEKDAHNYYAYPLVINQTAGRPGADPALRQAIFQAIDPKAWNVAANGGRGVLSSSFLTPDAHCYASSTKSLAPSPSVAKAKATLTAAGYTVSGGSLEKGGQPITIQVLGRPDYNAGPDYLGNVLQQLGVKINLRNVDSLTYASAFQKGDWDITAEYLPTATPEPGVNIAFFTGSAPPKGTNFARVLDDKVSLEVNAALQAPLSDRCQLWAQVQETLLKDHDILPTAGPTSSWFAEKVDFVPQNTFVEPYTFRLLR